MKIKNKNLYLRNLKGRTSNLLGIKVDKSNATEKFPLRDTVFRKGSSLNN